MENKDLYNESLEGYSENEIAAIKSYSDNFYNYKKALAYDVTKNYFSDIFNDTTEYVDSDYEQTNKEYKEYSGEYSNGKRNGKGHMKFQNGDEYLNQWQHLHSALGGARRAYF